MFMPQYQSYNMDGMPNTNVASEWLALPLRNREVPLSNIPSTVTDIFVVFLIPSKEKQRKTFTIQQTTKAQTGNAGISLLFL
jgi:hypothetical protein